MYSFIPDGDSKIKRPKNPKTNANLLKIITFSWLFEIFKIGRQRDLEENDLYTTLNNHTSSSLGNELEKKWTLELTNACETNHKPSLLKVLIKMFGTRFILYGLQLFIVEIIFKMAQPIFIGGILMYFNPDNLNGSGLRYAYICTFGLLFCILASMVIDHYTYTELTQLGMQIRISCCSLIFRKALRLNHKARSETTVGQVVNLLSNDVFRFDSSVKFINYLWIGPLQTIIVTYFLWQEIGVSSLLGIATLLFFIPLQGWLGKKTSEIRLKTATKTDKRVRLMHEIITGIQVIKMYTWEKSFAKLIKQARENEIQQIKGTSYIKAISSSFTIIETRFQLFISILSYVLLGNYISVKKVFIIMSFYNLLVTTMTIFLCLGLTQMAEVLVSIKRIQEFFLNEEKDTQILNSTKTTKTVNNGIDNNIDVKNNSEYLNSVTLVINNITAKWMTNQIVNSLQNINLTVRRDQLVAIIGPVGAGKSTLLQAVLRELPLIEGKISVNGVVSYASQEPWLFSGSIQQNILFDSSMDIERYNQVIQICALNSDFKQLPGGDLSKVGDRGVTLSGGQKARINLARSIYKQADIYLLDDPLSAVDTRVGNHLFEKCIKGYLKGKICILVTHQIQYLNNVDKIVLMDNGRILAEGSYQELQTSGFDFTKLLRLSDETISKSNKDIYNNNNENSKLDSISLNSESKKSDSLSDHELELTESLKIPKQGAESRSLGHVSKDVYKSYFMATGNVFKVICCFSIYIFTQLLTSGGDYWISYWVNQEEYVIGNTNRSSNSKLSISITYEPTDTFMNASNFRQKCIVVYTFLIIAMLVAVSLRSIIVVSFFMEASTNLHKNMFNAVIRATMNFFNTNSSGQILNRFSKDIGALDELLPLVLLDCFQISVTLMAISIFVGFVNIYLLIPTFIFFVIFYLLRDFYLPTSRSIKRLEGVTRSPIIGHLNASVQGLTTIRAFNAEKILQEEFDVYQDKHSSAWYLFISSTEAFGLWMDFISCIYISIVLFSFFIIGNRLYGGNVGLVLTQIIGLVGMIQWGIRQSAELENQMTSVERIVEYTKIPQEVVCQSLLYKLPPKGWPTIGKITFQNFNLRYNPNDLLVLKNLNFVIQPMEKIGIVGRTGAGKSSLIQALFRLACNEGSIIVDGIDINELELHDLRSSFSIIPQEPVLFSGTMRTNLDPFNEYPDHVLWDALEEVELKVTIENLKGGLNTKMSESGSNFSVGQKQLMCLARAIIRNNKILILDEATANVDPQTDALIQNTIRNKFRTCTVLTIAHRLNTIMNSDRVLVMDIGRAVEFDHPYNLLKNELGYFYKMVEQTGQPTFDVLRNIASENINAIQFQMELSTRHIDEDSDGSSKNSS